jgi:hypothetical protein
VLRGVEIMEKKELLNEENYEKTKKKITTISLIILIVALLIGSTLIALGVIKTNTSKKDAEKVNQERYNASEQRLKEIASEKESLNLQYDAKNQECDSLDMSAKDWYSKVNQCRRDASAISSKITNLESEEFKLNNNYDKVEAKNYIPLSVFGGVIIFIGGMISLSIYLIAKKRDISAFAIQQSMPLAQEVIGKMAPTIGDAGKTVIDKVGPSIGNAAGSIAKGIKDGLKDEDKSDEK